MVSIPVTPSSSHFILPSLSRIRAISRHVITMSECARRRCEWNVKNWPQIRFRIMWRWALRTRIIWILNPGGRGKEFHASAFKDLAIATWKLLGWKVVGWRRQKLRIWRRKCTESILLCFVLTDLCVASISDNLRTTVIAQPRTRLAVNRMIAQNFKSLLIHEKSNWLLFFCFWFLFQRLADQIGYET